LACDRFFSDPRLVLREDVVEGIVTQLERTQAFPEEHALLVRPMNGRHEIIAGWHRWTGAGRVGLAEIPCWVMEMTDDEAFMQLVLCNARGELYPLEIGIHVLDAVSKGEKGRGRKGGIRAYAAEIGKNQKYLGELRQAAEVFRVVTQKHSPLQNEGSSPHFLDRAKHLAAIHKAPRDTWVSLAITLLKQEWTVQETETAVKRVQEVWKVIPTWWVNLNRAAVAWAVAGQERRDLRAMFALAGELAAKLKPLTIYVLMQTDEVETRDGREYRHYVPVAEIYDPGVIFRERVQQELTLPDAPRVSAIHTEILSAAQAQSQAPDEWRPVLTEDEWAAQEARLAALAQDARRRYYTPTVLHMDVMAGLRSIATASVDLLATDPPYGMGIADWDVIPDYAAWAEPWLTECVRVLKPTGSLYVFGSFVSMVEVYRILNRLGMRTAT
jgi:DNA methylase/ParB/Sulfiredoxin domain